MKKKMVNIFTYSACLLLLLLPLAFLNRWASGAATDSKLIWSIDCGSSKSYEDARKIHWISDASLINFGVPKSVSSAVGEESLKTLREFPASDKACYTLGIVRPGQILVRATFNYGNYDGKSLPPTFDLEFDGNRWATVKTSIKRAVVEEAIYVVEGNSTEVCVVKINAKQTPFVSAIEVRRLSNEMYTSYHHQYSAMVLLSRRSASRAEIRYPDDIYDRIWAPLAITSDLKHVDNNGFINLKDDEDDPPDAIFKSAITPAEGNESIRLPSPLPSDTLTAYVKLYITEVTSLNAGFKRRMEIYVDRNLQFSPFIPMFGRIAKYYIYNVLVSGSSEITLMQGFDATELPVISAMEAFVIIPRSGKKPSEG